MTECSEVIPPPPIVREALARSLREATLLRRQLRLSVRAAENRCRLSQPPHDHTIEADSHVEAAHA